MNRALYETERQTKRASPKESDSAGEYNPTISIIVQFYFKKFISDYK